MSRLSLIASLVLLLPAPALAEHAHGPALFLPVEKKGAIACTYRTKTWSVREAQSPTPDGTSPRFVRLRLWAALEARVELPENEAVPPRVKLVHGGVVLNGGVESRDLLYPQRPIRVSEVLHAHQRTRLRWLGGKKGRVKVGFPELHRSYRAVNPRTSAMVMCADVGLEEGAGARFRKTHGVKRHAEMRWVRLKEEVPVSAEPGGGPRIFLPPAIKDPFFDADSGRQMYFIKLKKGRMKILTPAWNLDIVGWVNARALRRKGGEQTPVGIGEPASSEPISDGAVACPVDLKLYARAGGKTARVGVVRQGARVRAHNGGGEGWLRITLPGARWFAVAPEAVLLLRQRDRRRCPGL